LAKKRIGKKEKQEAAEKTYRAIGRFIFEFSQLEYEIRYRLSEALDVAPWYFNEAMVHDFSPLCTAAISVFQLEFVKEKNRFADIEKLVNKARQFADLRNAVAHGLWIPFKEGGTLVHVPRSKLKGSVSTEQAAALEKKADEVLAVRVAIAKICDEDYREEAKTRGKVWKS
jgi:hypothetical protein